MHRKDIFVRGWDYAYDIEDWYPPLNEALKDVDAEQALWKAPGNASHTISELVIHLLYYKKRFLFRLERKDWPSTISSNDDTFLASVWPEQVSWEQLVRDLASVHKQIREKLITLADGDLDSKLPENPIGRQLLSLIMHDAYHTGQIILIRKLYGSWPEVRNP